MFKNLKFMGRVARYMKLEEQAESGDANAHFELGMRFLHGDGVRQEPEEAIRHFKAAGDGGVIDGFNAIASMYSEGVGVPMNKEESVRWFQRAAEYGHPKAQLMLGLAYLDGTGVHKDIEAARNWLSQAAMQGDIEARDIFLDHPELK